MEEAIQQLEVQNENNNNELNNSRMIQAVRSSNFIAIQNLNSKFVNCIRYCFIRYKSIVKEIIQRLLNDLEHVILNQCNKFLSQVVEVKSQLFEATVKIKQQLAVITEQEIIAQELKLKHSALGDGNSIKKMRLKFENQLSFLEQDNSKLNSEIVKCQMELEHFKQQYYQQKYQHNLLKQEYDKQTVEFNLQTSEMRDKLQASQIQADKDKDKQKILEQKLTKIQSTVTEFSGPNKKESDQIIIEQQQEILKLRRDLENIRKNKPNDSSLRQKVIQQFNDIQQLTAAKQLLEKNYQELLQLVNQPATKVLDQLNQFLLHPPHLKILGSQVDHYYQSPKNIKKGHFNAIPKFDLNQVDYDEINQSHVSTINKLKTKNQINTFLLKKQENIQEIHRPRLNSLFQKTLGSPSINSNKLQAIRSITEDDKIVDLEVSSVRKNIISYKNKSHQLPPSESTNNNF